VSYGFFSMLYIPPPSAISHPEILPQWSGWMNQTRKASQMEMFCERKATSDQLLRELAPDQRAELENGITVALSDNVEAPTGGVGHDA
jgi:hypothetical protein